MCCLTKNIKKGEKFLREVQSGRLWINGNIKQNYPNLPIGGFKWSGMAEKLEMMDLKIILKQNQLLLINNYFQYLIF